MRNSVIKIISLLLCFVMVVGMCACTKSDVNTNNDTETDFLIDETDETEAEDRESKDTESKINEMENFLSQIAYPRYKLLDSSTPGFVGRWFEKTLLSTDHMVTLNDGSSFYFLTKGADSFDVNFTLITPSTVPYFSYSIDGSTPVRQLITNPTVKLPNNGMHTVCIYADGVTEKVGKWNLEIGFAFKNVEVNKGELMGIMPQNKVIAFYGDSITQGSNALGLGGTSEANSATHAYPYYCTKALEATAYYVGFGGSGVCRAGSFNTFINAIDYLSVSRKVDDSFRPDVIVINHGTNDVKHEDAVFEAELRKTLNRVIEKYSDTPIFYVIPFGQYKAQVIRKVCAEYGDKINVIESATWNITYTDGLHPNTVGAKNAGEQLANSMKAVLGEDFFKN